MQEIKWNSRRLKSLLTVGATLWVISGVAVFVLPSQMHNLMYPLAMVIGAANALVMVKHRRLERNLRPRFLSISTPSSFRPLPALTCEH
jgi:hypothetical protein